MAAVPCVLTSAGCSSSALRDSRGAGVPLPGLAPSPLSQDCREEVLEGALKVGERKQTTKPKALPTTLL